MATRMQARWMARMANSIFQFHTRSIVYFCLNKKRQDFHPAFLKFFSKTYYSFI